MQPLMVDTVKMRIGRDEDVSLAQCGLGHDEAVMPLFLRDESLLANVVADALDDAMSDWEKIQGLNAPFEQGANRLVRV